MPNTVIWYMYRDADNYKAGGRAILEGTLTRAQKQAIEAKLDEEKYFIPGQVGLADLQDSFVGCESEWNPDRDHPWHTLSSIEETDLSPTVDMSAEDLAGRFAAVEWDESYLPPFHAVMEKRYNDRIGREAEGGQEQPAPGPE
jgi:hypothetical protein